MLVKEKYGPNSCFDSGLNDTFLIVFIWVLDGFLDLAWTPLKKLRLKLIEALYGEHYRIHPIPVDVDEIGHAGSRRERLYIILSPIQVLDPKQLYKSVAQCIKSKLSTRPRDYFFSSDREIHLAATDLALTRKIQMRKAP